MIQSSLYLGNRSMFILLLLLFIIDYASGNCPRNCGGHGVCSTNNICVCEALYNYSPDCTMMVCPQGYAWADKAYAENSAHVTVECSNQGVCDRKTVIVKQLRVFSLFYLFLYFYFFCYFYVFIIFCFCC